VGAALIHADRRTDVTILGSFRTSVNSKKKNGVSELIVLDVRNFFRQKYCLSLMFVLRVIRLLEITNTMHKFAPLLCSYMLAATCRTTTLRHTGHLTTLYDKPPYRSVFSRNLRRIQKLPEDGRLLPKHVGASVYE
jgi:hypothetical protein